MGIETLLNVMVVVLHGLVFFRSSNPKRKQRLVVALLTVVFALPMALLGILIGLSGHYTYRHLAFSLVYAPVYMPLISLSVYLTFTKSPNTSKKQPSQHRP